LEENQASINNKIAALGVNRSVVSERYGVSRSAFYTNIKRYDEGRYDEIAPGLLSFFRFIDERAQTKNDVSNYLSNKGDNDDTSSSKSFSFDFTNHHQTDLLTTDFDSQSDLLNKGLCSKMLKAYSRSINATGGRINQQFSPDYVSYVGDGKFNVNFMNPTFPNELSDRLMSTYAMLEILSVMSKDPALSDTGLINVIKAKEYIQKAKENLEYIFYEDDECTFDENVLLSRISFCNQEADDADLAESQWFAAVVLFPEETSDVCDLVNLTSTVVHASSKFECVSVLKRLISQDIGDSGSIHSFIFGPYDRMSTADNVLKYLNNDWRVIMSPNGKPVKIEAAQDWLDEKKRSKALKRGLN